ncbi:flavodoxin [Fusobacterium necrophorum subsp. funduliforme]|uniref:flavodoxin family protein n=1 Tax=Fusobacterium necrophorum TaxID=859 RepID=UPI000788FC9F|nr:flavodoxin family protein [Fusobacterium necrophorum]AYV92650.1 flavodoxin [Fusobacterium necrophorum subsp. funduliforme]KYM44196.1 flavodoxin [Fusobacterium necrophorum subsp. funduliforme]
MKTLVVYSSLTGNTKKATTWAFEAVIGEKKLLSVDEAMNIDLSPYTKIVHGFWVDKGSLDSKSRKFLKRVKGKEIIFIGTLGAYPDSDHAKKVTERSRKIAEEENHYLGTCMVQGKMSDSLLASMDKFPLNLIFRKTEERWERIKVAALHPNEEDKRKIQEFVRNLY